MLRCDFSKLIKNPLKTYFEPEYSFLTDQLPN